MSGTTQQSVPFDARPLTEPVDRADVKRFSDELSRRFPSGTGAGAVVAVIVIVFVGVMILGFGGLILSILLMVADADGASGAGFWVSLGIAALVIGAVVWGVRAFQGQRRERQYRLDRFARANGMSYLPSLGDPALPGMIFGLGRARRSNDLVRGEAPRFAEFANYQYTTGSGKNQTTHRWGYVAIRLDAPLPHIVLDAVGNNTIFGSNLPVGFDKDQRLSLEGDFDRHFALYCPQGYEADALYLFTPDIMARFLDHAGQLDVEIVDDWLFLYTRREVSTLDPATWAWLFSVVAALIHKLDQWGRWRDERFAAGTGVPRPIASGHHEAPAFSAAAPLTPPPRGVAEPGRRLKRRFSWFGIVIIAFVILQFVLQVMGVLD
ncbi:MULTISPECIES: hypothetical protein [unclassified Microbacterium]|uniref:hypothetical protein n=1 Tax=Microbacterium TaxID=33882 RepID=UPI003BA12447